MSKSASTYMIPGLGGTALVVGLAFAYASKDYGQSEIAMLETRVGQLEQSVDQKATDLAAATTAAATETARADELSAAVERIKSEAMALASAGGGTIAAPAPTIAGTYGIGRDAHAEEIAAWDVDILPDGRGLPEGKGDVLWGEEVFAEKCASCHGDFAEGVDNWPVLAGGFDTLADKDPVKTVGSYWPYLSTVWDYVNRSMPFGAAQTLTDDEVYGIVAYILYSNDLVDEDFVLSHENFAEFEMYNKDGFVVDDREATEYPMWRTEPCMSDCKESVEITMRASVLDVTPEEEGSGETPAVEVAETQTSEAATPSFDPELVAAGEKAFKKCKACHTIGDGAKHKTGPHLNGVFGRAAAGSEGFTKYSKAMKSAGADGLVWDDATLAEFLAKPRTMIKGTKMSFAGFKKVSEITAILEYLRSAGG